jgi:hypothetical protein
MTTGIVIRQYGFVVFSSRHRVIEIKSANYLNIHLRCVKLTIELSESAKKNAEDVKKLQEDIERVDSWTLTAADNGLFKNQKCVRIEDIQNILEEARLLGDPNNPTFSVPKCQAKISKAAGKYAEALHCSQWCWRATNIYAVHIWLYLLSFLGLLILFYYYGGIDYLIEKLNTLSTQDDVQSYRNGIYSVVWGIIGGIFRGIWYLKRRVNDRGFRNSWILWYLSSPIVGGILGVITYLLIVGGLLTLSDSELNTENSLLVMAVAAIAGYNWPAATDMIRRVGDSVTGSKSPS